MNLPHSVCARHKTRSEYGTGKGLAKPNVEELEGAGCLESQEHKDGKGVHEILVFVAHMAIWA